jgi:hypothetical protein
MGDVDLKLLRKARDEAFKSFKKQSGTPSAQDAYMKLLEIDLQIGKLDKVQGNRNNKRP